MFDWVYKISQIYEPTLSTQDLLALRAKVGELEGDVAELREMATALARFVNAVAAEDRSRDVAEGYAAIKTGLGGPLAAMGRPLQITSRFSQKRGRN